MWEGDVGGCVWMLASDVDSSLQHTNRQLPAVPLHLLELPDLPPQPPAGHGESKDHMMRHTHTRVFLCVRPPPYPLSTSPNPRVTQTTTPFHLALVLLLLFCFPPALQLQPTASGGAGEGDDGMHDLCVFSPATMEMQEPGTRRSEGAAPAASAASPVAWSLRSQL